MACECDSGFIEVNGACVAEACDSNPGLCGFKEECVDLSGTNCVHFPPEKMETPKCITYNYDQS